MEESLQAISIRHVSNHGTVLFLETISTPDICTHAYFYGKKKAFLRHTLPQKGLGVD